MGRAPRYWHTARRTIKDPFPDRSVLNIPEEHSDAVQLRIFPTEKVQYAHRFGVKCRQTGNSLTSADLTPPIKVTDGIKRNI